MPPDRTIEVRTQVSESLITETEPSDALIKLLGQGVFDQAKTLLDKDKAKG